MITIASSAETLAFVPGEMVSVAVSWDCEADPNGIDVELLWYTAGKGTEDVKTVWSEQIPTSGTRGSRNLRIPLPDGPYSCSGKYVSILWAIEAIAHEGEDLSRLDIVVSPTKKPVSFWSGED